MQRAVLGPVAGDYRASSVQQDLGVFGLCVPKIHPSRSRDQAVFIGEVARATSDESRDRFRKLPWTDVVELRTLLAHHYQLERAYPTLAACQPFRVIAQHILDRERQRCDRSACSRPLRREQDQTCMRLS